MSTEAVIGHPVVCDNKDLILQVTQRPLRDGGYAYYVAVNNPTDKTITAVLRKNMPLQDFDFDRTRVQVAPGGYVKVFDR